MAATTKPRRKQARRVPAPGRKLDKREARDYVFKTYRQALELLAKH